MSATSVFHRFTGWPMSPLNGLAGRKSLAILGASQELEPPILSDPGWDVWGCNSLWNYHKDFEGQFRADLWFELHPLTAQTDQEVQDMVDCPVPLMVIPGEALQEHWQEFPLQTLRETFGTRDYYTCTFAYQIALAILKGYERIGLFGVELMHGSARERTVEIACLNYWLGVAQGLGRQVVLPDYSQLLRHDKLYGLEYKPEIEVTDGIVDGIVKSWLRNHKAVAK